MTRTPKERLQWLAALIIVLAIGYFAIRYFWPWYVKWCMEQ